VAPSGSKWLQLALGQGPKSTLRAFLAGSAVARHRLPPPPRTITHHSAFVKKQMHKCFLTPNLGAFPEILQPCGARIFGFWHCLPRSARLCWAPELQGLGSQPKRKRNQKSKRPLLEGRTAWLQDFLKCSNPGAFYHATVSLRVEVQWRWRD
jgi:hypothetical protein